MKKNITEIEELVLLNSAPPDSETYGMFIREQNEKRANRSTNIGALHPTISSLEDRGYSTSLVEASSKTASRKNRYLELKIDVISALTAMKELRESQVKLGYSK